jgi:glucose-6-phosphate 1-epimerase
MGDEEFSRMLCVEAAVVDKPITLLPGEHWAGTQALEVLI